MLTLDVFGKAMYKRLKEASDDLERVRCGIQYNKRLLQAYTELWFESLGRPEEHEVYLLKHATEVKISNLECREKELEERVREKCR